MQSSSSMTPTSHHLPAAITSRRIARLGDEERRGREGHHDDHAGEQADGPHAVDVDVVADAVDAVAVVNLPHDGHLQEEAALDERVADDVEHGGPRRPRRRCPVRWPRYPCSRPWSGRGSACSCSCGAGRARRSRATARRRRAARSGPTGRPPWRRESYRRAARPGSRH